MYIILNSLALAFILVVFAWISPLRNYYRGLPAMHKGIVCILGALILLGHASARDRQSYPFGPWWMYGASYEGDSITYYKYVGCNNHGEEVEIIPSSQFPVLGRGTFRLTNHLRDLTDSDQTEDVLNLLKVIGNEYNSRHPQNTLNRIRVERRSYLFPTSSDSEASPEEGVAVVIEVAL